MSGGNRASYILVIIVLIASITGNIFLYNSQRNSQFLLKIMTERLKINEEEKSEIAFSQFSKLSENVVELARGQGRIEAFATLANNLPVQESDVSAIFHAGLDSGYGTALQLIDSVLSNMDEKVVATIQKIPNVEETRIPAGNVKNATSNTKDILDYWNSSKKTIQNTINSKVRDGKKSEYTWKDSLITRARKAEIDLMLDEAREEGRLQGYHDATEDGVCPAPGATAPKKVETNKK